MIGSRKGDGSMIEQIKKLTLDKIVFFLLCVLMVDCCIFGAGRTISFGPIGFRMALAGMLLALTIPLAIKKARMLLSNKFLWILLAFALWLIIQAVVGIVCGNLTSVIVSDLKGFSYFAIVLPAICVLTEKRRVHILMKAMMCATAVLGVAGILILCIHNWDLSTFYSIYNFDNQFNLAIFASVNSKLLRVFFKSSNYLLCGCTFPLYFVLTDKNSRIRWCYPLLIGLSLLVLLLSYTRSIYLAMALAAGMAIILCLCFTWKKNTNKLLKLLSVSVLVFVVLIACLNVVFQYNYLEYAFERVGVTFAETTNDATLKKDDSMLLDRDDSAEKEEYQQATIQSDNLRKDTMNELLELISSSPIVGHGLGKNLVVRDSGYNEYFYLDLMAKTGIIGLILFLIPFGLMVFYLLKRKEMMRDSWFLAGMWLSVLIGFMAFSFFNPYMNASLGISFYCCTIGVFCCFNDSTSEKKSTDSV